MCVWLLTCGFVLSAALHSRAVTEFPVSQEQLQALQDEIAGIQQEKDWVRQRVDMLIMQKTSFLYELDTVTKVFALVLAGQGDAQDKALRELAKEIKGVLHYLASAEAHVAEESAIAQSVDVTSLSRMANQLLESNRQQSAEIAGLATAQSEDGQKVYKAVDTGSQTSSVSVDVLVADITLLETLLSTKKCDFSDVYVGLDNVTASEEVIPLPSGMFDKLPDVSCGLCSVTSDLRTELVTPYNIGLDEHECTGVWVDCKVVNNTHMVVAAFDHSRGVGNDIIYAKVQIQACSFNPLGHGG
ncbi:uncharacterized protein LOC143277116 [Babylonia areolata]|uniref:uncharacterized protein LOC143277116 n=1 Tax=Babylonia areolata TaxID=304850 RepID=UPI003FD492E1